MKTNLYPITAHGVICPYTTPVGMLSGYLNTVYYENKRKHLIFLFYRKITCVMFRLKCE